jgi:hypothetical protein
MTTYPSQLVDVQEYPAQSKFKLFLIMDMGLGYQIYLIKRCLRKPLQQQRLQRRRLRACRQRERIRLVIAQLKPRRVLGIRLKAHGVLAFGILVRLSVGSSLAWSGRVLVAIGVFAVVFGASDGCHALENTVAGGA